MNVPLLLALVLLAGCAVDPVAGPEVAANSSGSQAPASDGAAIRMTRLTIDAPTCEGCSITAYQAVWGQYAQPNLAIASDVVRKGRLVFEVPTKLTVGMAFVVRNFPGGYVAEGGADPLLVVGYGGRAPGLPISPTAATREYAGSWCWEGTTRSSFTIHVRSVTFQDPAAAPSRLVSLWASPTLNVLISAPNLRRTVRGGLGADTVPACAPNH